MSTAIDRPHVDQDEIRRALCALHQAGGVVEMRAFKNSRCTVSGYYTDHDKLADDSVRVNRMAGGVYVVLNQIDPDLLARRANRFEEYAKTTTADKDITRRQWLPIDLDPARPAGISSSETEHEAAIETAGRLAQFLTDELSWPAPIVADSGNGAHVLFRIDLPNDDNSTQLVQACLQALDDHFSKNGTAVDTGVYKARMGRLPRHDRSACRLAGEAHGGRSHGLRAPDEAPSGLQLIL